MQGLTLTLLNIATPWSSPHIADPKLAPGLKDFPELDNGEAAMVSWIGYLQVRVGSSHALAKEWGRGRWGRWERGQGSGVGSRGQGAPNERRGGRPPMGGGGQRPSIIGKDQRPRGRGRPDDPRRLHTNSISTSRWPAGQTFSRCSVFDFV